MLFSFLINPGDSLKGAPEASSRQVVCSEQFQNIPVGTVVVDCWEFEQRLPQRLRYRQVLRRVALELSYLYIIL